MSTIWRGSVDLAELRRQVPLPETADELCAVAKSLGALAHEADAVWLGARATETNLKTLSGEGKLARYRVLHFATHGLLASESETILKAKAEPALVLTPPKDGASAAELERDDGLLTASEVAQLQLDADWVVLSACNTAAGDKGDAEALAGLARAYFYAKARALLVSHWAVDSDATVELITKTVAALRTDPRIGRAEALRRSMASLISKGDAFAHPATWAPFVLVGEGQAHTRAPTAATNTRHCRPQQKPQYSPIGRPKFLHAEVTQYKSADERRVAVARRAGGNFHGCGRSCRQRVVASPSKCAGSRRDPGPCRFPPPHGNANTALSFSFATCVEKSSVDLRCAR